MEQARVLSELAFDTIVDRIEAKLSLLKWLVGPNLAATLAVLVKVLVS